MFKIVIISIFLTLSAASLAAIIFFKSILGFFDYVAIPAAEFAVLSMADTKLKTANKKIKVVEKKNINRQNKLSKRHMKRASKRAALGAGVATVAPMVVDSVVVAGIVVYFEAEDYCQEQSEIYEIEAIIKGKFSPQKFDYSMCMESAEKSILLLVSDTKEAASGASTKFTDTLYKKYDEYKESFSGYWFE
ncbi:MAG: hypothetical protein HOH69_03745 [Gammaproteobacteria bacterium]|nr:hypothetical protein [Gammaproteobacteria bacterium]